MLGSTAFQSRMEDGIHEFLKEIVIDSGTRMSLYIFECIYISVQPCLEADDQPYTVADARFCGRGGGA